ncbi:DUF4314 domain-containing protein [Streptococcus suis]
MQFLSQSELETLRSRYVKGMRVRLIRMEDEQAPPIGTKGTVIGVDDIDSIMVAWDNGSRLSVVYGVDQCSPLMSDQLKTQIETVRVSGCTNMLDTKAVQFIANQMSLYELVILIEEEKETYLHYLLSQK